MITLSPHSKTLRIGRYSQPGQIYSITTVTLNRTPIFYDFQIARQVITAIAYRQQKNHVSTLAYVLMPDHLHWLFTLGEKKNLSRLIQGFKRYSSWLIKKQHPGLQSIWQSGFYDHAIRHDEDLKCIARYIIANPLRAGLVQHIGDYPHWDAVWL